MPKTANFKPRKIILHKFQSIIFLFSITNGGGDTDLYSCQLDQQSDWVCTACLDRFRVFVVEQEDKNDFKRGKLMNIGYREAVNMFPYTCFVSHDVDLLPEDDRISYGSEHSPIHLSVSIDKLTTRAVSSSTNCIHGHGMSCSSAKAKICLLFYSTSLHELCVGYHAQVVSLCYRQGASIAQRVLCGVDEWKVINNNSNVATLLDNRHLLFAANNIWIYYVYDHAWCNVFTSIISTWGTSI